MAKPKLEDLTLREKFKEASHVGRDLMEHLEQGFLTRNRQLQSLVRPKSESSPRYEIDLSAGVNDITIRNEVARVLESENYTDELFEIVKSYMESIDQEIDQILPGV